MISGEARDTSGASAQAGRRALPPGPGGPAWGNFARYLRDPLRTMDGFAAEHGDVVFVRFPGGHSFFFVSDADLDPARARRRQLGVREGQGAAGGQARCSATACSRARARITCAGGG